MDSKHINKIFILSVSKSHQNKFINFLSNPNRLKFKPKELNFLNQNNFLIFEGIYEELFCHSFYKEFTDYIHTLFINNKELEYDFIGFSINGITSIFLSYLLTIVYENKMNIYSFAIPKFCNQQLIDEFEQKKNMNIKIINHIHDPVQLLIPPFTLNFKSIIFLDNTHMYIHTNKNRKQDEYIKNRFTSNVFSFLPTHHSSDYYFRALLV